jgi:hypothetical protein
MINKLTSLFSLFFIGGLVTAIAQPTLTSKFNPVVGTVSKVAFADTTGVTEGPAGANKTYDYTLALAPIGAAVSYTYKTVASTPYASQYTNATVAYQSPSAQGNSSYIYLKTSASAMENVGVATSDIQFTYTDLQKVLSYPFTMGNTFTDYFEGSGTNAQNITTYRKGTVTSTADAYGTLMLPSATFNNVLRVKTVQTFIDSINLFGDEFITRYNITTYNFFIDDVQQQLLGISYTYIDSDLFGEQDYKTVQYFPDSYTGVAKVTNNTAVKIYPNPAADNFSINIENTDAPTRMDVTDITGKTVLTHNYNSVNQDINVSVANLAQGLYVVNLYQNNALVGVQKLTVAR